MKFLDQAKIYVRSGNGGAGCAGFRREKFIEFGGPDGGDGGRGGDVILECVDGLNTLIDYRYAQHFKAETGHHGMGSQRTGGAGKDIMLRLPRGTQVFAEDNETLLADLTEIGQRIVLLKGGDGGYGNLHYKSSTNRAPRRADKGWPGEELWIWLRLKLIADIGLVGLPNAGKSTFLAATSNARPKIADYPFTTLTPGLGVVKVGDREFVMADIPGLIEGAHEGSGLGTRFLGHVERCRALLHLVDGTQDDIVGAYRTVRGRAQGLWRQPGAQEGNRGAEQDRRHDRRGHRGQARAARQGQPQGGARDLRRLGPRRAAPAARADEARRQAARPRERKPRDTPGGGPPAGHQDRLLHPGRRDAGRGPARLAGKPDRQRRPPAQGRLRDRPGLVRRHPPRAARSSSCRPARSSSRKARPPPPPARSSSPMPTRRRWRGTASPWRRCC